MSSVVSPFENRHNAIQHNTLRISTSWVRYLVTSANYLVSFSFPIPFLFNIPNQESAKLLILQNVPCPQEEFFTLSVFSISTDANFRLIYMVSMLIFLCSTFVQLLFYAFTCLRYLVFSKSSSFSKRTIELQKKFFIGILIQVLVPYAFIVPSVSYCCYSVYSNYYNQSCLKLFKISKLFKVSVLNNFFVLVFNFYGTVSTIGLISCHTAYWKFARKLIMFKSRTDLASNISVSRNNQIQ